MDKQFNFWNKLNDQLKYFVNDKIAKPFVIGFISGTTHLFVLTMLIKYFGNKKSKIK